jgi:GNAT superfamily N-acetyltransferase
MGGVLVRRAQQADLDVILSLYEELAESSITAAPADGTTAAPLLAKILADPARELAVAIVDGQLVGTADLLIVPNLTHRGEPWAILENVIITSTARRAGAGRKLMEHLIELARAAGCYKLQLISGKHRPDAHAFYRSLGLDAVAEGFKIYFDV